MYTAHRLTRCPKVPQHRHPREPWRTSQAKKQASAHHNTCEASTRNKVHVNLRTFATPRLCQSLAFSPQSLAFSPHEMEAFILDSIEPGILHWQKARQLGKAYTETKEDFRHRYSAKAKSATIPTLPNIRLWPPCGCICA